MIPYNQAENPEDIPLTALPLYDDEEQDLAEEHLPTYNEVITSGSPRRERRRRDERPQSPMVTLISSVSEPAIVPLPLQNAPPPARRGSVPPLSAVVYLLVSMGLLVTGIVLYSQTLNAQFDVLILSGVMYVNSFVPVVPPTATYTSDGQLKLEFIIFLTVGSILLYPVIVLRYGICSWIANRVGNNRRQSQNLPQAQKRKTTISLLFSIIYFGGLIAAILGTLQLAKTRQRNSYSVYTSQPWSNKYVVLDDPSSNSFYSTTGARLGFLNVIERNGFSGLAMVQIDEGSMSNTTVQMINYPLYFPMQFTATCQSTSNSSVIDNCVSGNFINQPAPGYFGVFDPSLQMPDYSGFLNLSVQSPNPLAFLNHTANPNVWTTSREYQGIGGLYAPLGQWYVDNVTGLEVGWSLGDGGPCDGLQINLSEDYEEISWILVGIIWQWWVYWTQNWGSCSVE